MCMDGQVCKRSAQHVQDKTWGWFSITEVRGAEVDYHLDEIAAHLKQDLLHLVRVYLHAKGYEVKHCFVLQDR